MNVFEEGDSRTKQLILFLHVASVSERAKLVGETAVELVATGEHHRFYDETNIIFI